MPCGRVVSGSVLPFENAMCESVPWNVLTQSAGENWEDEALTRKI
jgi:hypothetical protein